MKSLLNGIWHDLREKRMWPVALALLVALVALPVAVLQPASEEVAAPAAPGEAAAPNPAEQAIVSLAEDAGVDVSSLDAFRSNDPFAGGPATESESGASGDAPAAPGGTTAAPATPTGGDDGGSSSKGGGGSGAPGKSGGSGGGTTGTSQGGTGTTPDAGTTFYTYTVDVRFGRRGRIRSYDLVERLQMLPNERSPLLVFLGVTTSGKTAVFLVDSGLEQRGEGTCRPRPTREDPACNFLYLRDDADHDQHYFTDVDGRRYDIRLTDIERVSVEELQERKEKEKEEAEKEKASGSGSGAERRRAPSFEPPLFADDGR